MALQKAIAKNRMPGLKADGEIEIAQGTPHNGDGIDDGNSNTEGGS